jgi:hypothetical protein
MFDGLFEAQVVVESWRINGGDQRPQRRSASSRHNGHPAFQAAPARRIRELRAPSFGPVAVLDHERVGLAARIAASKSDGVGGLSGLG